MSTFPNRKVSPPLSVADLCARLSIEAPAPLARIAIAGVATLEHANAGELSYLADAKHLEKARASAAGAILVPATLDTGLPNAIPAREVMPAMLAAIAYFHPDPARTAHRDPSASIHPTATLGADVHVGAHVTIGEGASIGDRTRLEAGAHVGDRAILGPDCWLAPGAKVLHECILGARVQLHAGAVIGADGFRYEVLGRRLVKIPQVGNVVLEDDVEIGANAAIDRAFLETTRIGARTKIDNLVHVAHNVQVGPDCIIVAQVGIAGSTKLGRGVQVGGQVGIKDHIEIGAGVKIGAQSGVHNNIPAGSQLIGTPPVPVKTYARWTHFQRNFDEYWEKLRPLLYPDRKGAPPRGDA